MLKQLWNDESGAIISVELVLVVTILGLGMIVGLHTVRNAVVAELGDVAASVGSVNQSYSYAGAQGHSSWTDGSAYQDISDFCEGADDTPNCVDVSGTRPAAPEGQ